MGPRDGTTTEAESLTEVVRREVERTLQRSIKGLEYLASTDPQVGGTPKECIHERGTLKLYHYTTESEEVYRVPLLLIMSLISRPYILDLAPGQSLVGYLLGRGFDVYMVDWGVPRPEDKVLRLDDYVLDFIPDCVERVCADSGEREVSIVGYCLGGLLAVLYAALEGSAGRGSSLSGAKAGPLRNLACFTTPIDFEGMGLFRRWCDPEHFDVDRIVDTVGNVPPELLYASFQMLRPASRWVGRVRLWDNMWNDEFVTAYRRFDRWAADQIPFPGECFRQITRELLQENRLVQGTFRLGRRPVRLSDVRVPLLHVMAEHDHIVPYQAARCLVALAGSDDKQDVVLQGGHVSLVAGTRAVERLWPSLDAWLTERSL